MPKGRHFVAEQWLDGDRIFTNAPVEGAADRFAVGTSSLVDKAARAADEAFLSYC